MNKVPSSKIEELVSEMFQTVDKELWEEDFQDNDNITSAGLYDIVVEFLEDNGMEVEFD